MRLVAHSVQVGFYLLELGDVTVGLQLLELGDQFRTVGLRLIIRHLELWLISHTTITAPSNILTSHKNMKHHLGLVCFCCSR